MMTIAPAKSPGQLAYEADVAAEPFYHDDRRRPSWAQLSDAVRQTWERNPTPREHRKREAA